MSQGQEGDMRPMRRRKTTDFYEAKSAMEYKQPTSWPKCENCGLEISPANNLGKSYQGSENGKYICQQCWNETRT